MQALLLNQDTIAQDPQHSPASPDCGTRAPSQPVAREDDRARGSPLANPDRYHAPSTTPDQESAAQTMATPLGDETRLSHAVVIPQRRPNDRARGFVRAYAPDLLRCGINQATFLRFVDGLNKSVASNAAVEAVDLAGEAVGAIPGSEFVGAPIVGAAFQNGYLTKINDKLFRPRGLYCLIMSYDVKSRSNVVRPGQSDSPSHVIRQGISQGSKSSSMRSNDGILGASNFPATAQLVYPDPKDFPENNVKINDSEERARAGAWGSGRSKIQDLSTDHANKEDLKSQVKFQKKNPTSPINSLMNPKAELSEKDRQKQEKREIEQKKKEKKREREAEKRALKYPDKSPKMHKPKEGILYLIIVNIP